MDIGLRLLGTDVYAWDVYVLGLLGAGENNFSKNFFKIKKIFPKKGFFPQNCLSGCATQLLRRWRSKRTSHGANYRAEDRFA